MAGAVTGGGVSLRCRSMGAGSRRRLPHVSQPLGEALGTPPKLPVCRGHCSALRVAWTFPPPELRASQ